MPHIPVLLNDVLKVLGDINGKTIVDATLGAGGYSRAFLERGANVIAFDRDPSVIPFAEKLIAEYPSRFQFINEPFSKIGQVAILRNSPPAGESTRSVGGGQIQLHKHQQISERVRTFASTMRQNMTPSEKKFWYAVNNKKLGFKFCKQYPIDDKYIADFICLEKKLIVEIDGSQHYQNKKDEIRTEYLQKFGFNIVRFWNKTINGNLAGCVDIVSDILTNNSFEKRLEEFFKNLPDMKIDDRGNVVLPPTGNKLPTPPQGGSSRKLATRTELHDNIYAIVFDFGISSMQIDTPERGFSFRFDAPLDMRMEAPAPNSPPVGESTALPSVGGNTAAQLIEKLSANELTKILRDYGDVKKAGAIARAMKDKLPKTTFELKALIFDPNDVAPVFQALRIALNDELGEIERALSDIPALLPPGGICAAVSFHSLEDRLVKSTFREWATDKGDPRLPVTPENAATFDDIARGGIAPSAEELAQNPRARSARLRVVRKK